MNKSRTVTDDEREIWWRRMSRQERLQQCVNYFKEREGFERLLKESKEKYKSLGKIGGSVKLTLLSKVEQDTYEAFFQKRYPIGEEIRISLSSIEKKISESRFGEFTFLEILETYFGKKLISKKELQTGKDKRIEQYWHEFAEEYEGTFSGEWIKMLQGKKPALYHEINRRLVEGGKRSTSGVPSQSIQIAQLKILLAVGNSLPIFKNLVERLPVFATRVTGDPHFFDEGTVGNRFLTSMIQYYLEQRQLDLVEITKIQQYYEVGILKDDLLNYTTVYGFRMLKNDGQEHLGVKGFFEEKQPFHLTLRTLSHIGQVEAMRKRVYILENSGVYSELVDRLAGEDIPLICTNGQLHLSSQILLDKLAKDGFKLYYSGDFDPEGIEIAWKLKKRYGECFYYWHYGLEDYLQGMSDKEISQVRLARLNKYRRCRTRKGYRDDDGREESRISGNVVG